MQENPFHFIDNTNTGDWKWVASDIMKQRLAEAEFVTPQSLVWTAFMAVHTLLRYCFILPDIL
jgi:hypothetical protein